MQQLQLQGEAVIPEVVIEEEEIEIGGVTIGGHMKKAITLENKGNITAILFIDLERYPEFTVGLAPGEEGRTNEESVLVPVSDTRITTASTAVSTRRGNTRGSSRGGASKSRGGASSKEQEPPKVDSSDVAHENSAEDQYGPDSAAKLIFLQNGREHIFELPVPCWLRVRLTDAGEPVRSSPEGLARLLLCGLSSI